MEGEAWPRRRLLVVGALAGLAGCLGDDPPLFAVTVEVPETSQVGEELAIAWTVENEGDREDTQSVVLRVREKQQASEELTLSGGEREFGEFTVTPDSEGALPLTVSTDDDEVSVTVLVEST